MRPSPFRGNDFIAEYDHNRLDKQLERVKFVMADGRWYTVCEIRETIQRVFQINEPENSIQAQIRNLRKPEFGNYIIPKRRRGRISSGHYEWRITGVQKQDAQGQLYFSLL